MPLTILREFLDSHNVRYIVISHSPAFTAQGIAALAHIPGKELAKTLRMKAWRRIRRLHLTQARIENWFDWPGRSSKSWSNRR